MKLVDVTTGEIHLVGVIKKRKQKDSFIMVFQEQLSWLVSPAGPDLRARHYRVLLFLASQADYENWCRSSVSDMARRLQMLRSATSTTLKELEQFGLVQRHYPRPGFPAVFRLSPYAMWRGDATTRSAALAAEEEFEPAAHA